MEMPGTLDLIVQKPGSFNQSIDAKSEYPAQADSLG